MSEQRRPKGIPAPRGKAALPSKIKPNVATISPARAATFEILERVGTTSAHSDDLLHGPRLVGLSQADRDLTTALVLGVLRWQIALDARIRPLLSRPEATLPEVVAIALRMGAFQVLHMERIPAHAALNESVELVRSAGHEHAAGMVNAVLRKLIAAAAPRRPMVESTSLLAERLGHPTWLVERWVKEYGRPAAEAICGFDQKEPGCGSTFVPKAEDVGLPTMDAGSRLVAELAAAAGAGARRVWDCCAAPGGKTLVLARRLPQAEMLATDTSPVRLKRLAERVGRELPSRVLRLEQADAAALPSAYGDFDLILCDVPCSGTGTLARNPEIRHRLRAEDLPRQAERQSRILRGAVRRLAPGGRLVYSTCSLEPEECEGVVEEVCREPGLKKLSAADALEDLHQAGRLQSDEASRHSWVRKDSLRTLPGVAFEGDGFYAAVIERV